MAEICCGVVSQSGANPTCKPSSRAARRRRMEIRRFKFVGGGGVGVARPRGSETASGVKRRKLLDADEGSCSDEEKRVGGLGDGRLERKAASISDDSLSLIRAATTMATAALSRTLSSPAALELPSEYPKFGVSSVCGRRREMEDTVAVHPSFCRRRGEPTTELHYFGVYDGHGCSHVAVRCRERMHELIKEELAAANKEEGSAPTEWRAAMERSFRKMDEEAIAWNEGAAAASHERCRCELQSPECEAVGSTAVVAIVTPDKIVVANCGDSRAVLSRKGKAVPLSSDHKPDRPDELNRIQEAGGRVIYWGGPRVLGVLAMSRAIGDNYLKPYVSCDPEVTVMERTADDDCLILATDGLWDVVSNDSACGVASMCLRGKIPVTPEDTAAAEPSAAGMGRARPDRACLDTSLLLTKLALARHSTDNVSVVVVDLRRSC